MTASPADLAYPEIWARYDAPDRHYHGRAHIEAMLRELDAAGPLIAARHLVRLATLFHDAVYDPRAAAGVNEYESAALFLRTITDLPAVDRLAVATMIADTAGHGEDLPGDRAYFCDADLAAFGAPPAEWTMLEAAIRREYAWVPEAAFRTGRAAVLRGFLDRPAIYQTAFFRTRLERQARVNLEGSIAALGAAPD